MINVNLIDIQRRTYRRLLSQLTNVQVERLINFEQLVTRSINDAVYVGKWCVENIRIDDFDVLKLIIIDLQMKGFKAWYVSQSEPVEFKDTVCRHYYYTLGIDWELGD